MSTLIARGKPGEGVKCGGCEHEFKQDPPFEVACPYCKAKPGTYCVRPSEHRGPFVPFHAERDVLALKMGFYDHQDMGTKCGPHSSSERAKEIVAKFLTQDNLVLKPTFVVGNNEKNNPDNDNKQIELFS